VKRGLPLWEPSIWRVMGRPFYYAITCAALSGFSPMGLGTRVKWVTGAPFKGGGKFLGHTLGGVQGGPQGFPGKYIPRGERAPFKGPKLLAFKRLGLEKGGPKGGEKTPGKKGSPTRCFGTKWVKGGPNFFLLFSWLLSCC